MWVNVPKNDYLSEAIAERLVAACWTGTTGQILRQTQGSYD